VKNAVIKKKYKKIDENSFIIMSHRPTRGYWKIISYVLF
jgi:hypothetical protein